MEDLVEMLDLIHRAVDIVRDREKMEVGTGDESEFEQVIVKKSAPCLPVKSIGAIHQDDRDNGCLAGLEECQHLESLIHRAESSREKHKGGGFLHKAEFAGKEIIEMVLQRVVCLMF